VTEVPDPLRRLARLIRIKQWWDYKLTLALAIAYALAWRLHVGYAALWPALVLLLAAGIATAVYASVVNDLTDLEEDRVQGKITGMMSLSPNSRAAVLIASVAGLVAVGVPLYHYAGAFIVYAAIIAVFTLYSVRPFRIKGRGVWGVVFIALGEHMLAALIAVMLVSEVSRKPIPLDWVSAVLLWSLALGARGILWHQLEDYDNDRVTAMGTMGAKYSREALTLLGQRIVFPVELVSFAAVLVLSANLLAWKLLAVYVVLEWLRFKYLSANIVIVSPRPNERFAMFEYYQLFFPLSFLFADSYRDHVAAIVLLLQIILFPMPMWLVVSHVAHLLRWRVYPFLTTRS
jgi:4-hydroxybenzoate polyprenyltransferase